MPESGENDRGFPDEHKNGEGELADGFLKPDLPGRSAGPQKGVARSIDGEVTKRRVRARRSGRSETRQGATLPGQGPIVGSNVEEVWDEDPALPEEPVEPSVEEKSSEDSEKRVKKVKKLDEEQLWGWQRKTTLWWLASGVSAVLVVGYILQQEEQSRKPPATVEEPERFQSTVSLEDTPVSQLLVFGQAAVSQLVRTLQKVEESPEESVHLLANGEKTLSKMAGWRKKMGEKSVIKTDGVIGLMAAGIGDQGYLLMSGLRDDYSKYLAYFVERDGQLLLDWGATEGYSDYLPDELESLEVNEVAQLRAVVSLSSFYTEQFPESEYACVLISHIERESYAWGYVRRGTPEFDRLSSSLASPVTTLTAGRLTILVSGSPEGALPKQVVVREVVGSDWLERSPKGIGKEGSESQVTED